LQPVRHWNLEQEVVPKNHQPHPSPEPGCDNGYADARGLCEHRRAAHTHNNQSHSNPRPPSKTIDVVPQPELALDEEKRQSMPNGQKWWRFFFFFSRYSLTASECILQQSTEFQWCTMKTWYKGPNQQQNGTSLFIGQARPLWRRV